MESYRIEHLSFTYPGRERPALSDVSLTIRQGEFVTLCGRSGCGKTTLLRLLAPVLAPHGSRSGTVLFEGEPLSSADSRRQVSAIGFVQQSPEHQIVTDKVWHELAFGLESLGLSTPEIRSRVAEMASFFGIQTWFHKSVTELSGGQKQILNLASVMAMQPSVLILDEPTSQLDPIAAQEFLQTLYKINRELGTTILLSEHRLTDAIPLSDRVVVLDAGAVFADGTAREVCRALSRAKHEMYDSLPVPARVWDAVENELDCPLTVREGRVWLERFAAAREIVPVPPAARKAPPRSDEVALEAKELWFRYEKNLPDVVRGFSAKIRKGELFAILGGNGAGKSTALGLLCGLRTPQRGAVFIGGKRLTEIGNPYRELLGVLPQEPQSLFVKKTVFADLMEMLAQQEGTEEEKEARAREMAALCRIEPLLDFHPYDLSGGEQQRAALAKVLLLRPKILLLDEPTRGMDAHFKQIFADILAELTAGGVTVVMVSHDIEFCAEHADRCAMFFDGAVVSEGEPRAFFAGKSFYTTAANRMARGVLPDAVLAEDIILACGGKPRERSRSGPSARQTVFGLPEKNADSPASGSGKKARKKTSPRRIFFGAAFLLLFAATCVLQKLGALRLPDAAFQGLAALEIFCGFVCLFPRRELRPSAPLRRQSKTKLPKRTVVAAGLILLAIPLTIGLGVFYLQNRKYYFVSLLVLLETMLPFAMVFESRRPQARELIIISVLAAIAVAGRAAFFMLPQFKPVVAVVILSGVCFGGEAGFFVGAVAGLVSNFFFGQGPLTPWQMFSFGIIGFLAGVLFQKGLIGQTRLSLCVFGALAALVVYGGIMNPASVLAWQPAPTREMFVAAYLSGLPFDLIHAAATAFFLWFISEPMIDKLERVKIKYGLLER